MKIGIIGTGKRFFNVYEEIIKKLNLEVFIWNRSFEKIERFKSIENYKIVNEIKDFKNLNLDLCLSFIPGNVNFDVLGDLNLKCNLLIETPIIDNRWADKDNVGVLEQWVYLPIEQTKEKIYKSKIIERPYWVFNDGRSFDYHAIAQLRKYTKFKKPVEFFGKMQNIKRNKHFIDKEGFKNNTSDEWTHGIATLEDGTLLTHSFSYTCKLTKLKTFQYLRATSIDGSVTSGRTLEMDNDYENFEIRYLDTSGNVIVEKCKKKINDRGILKEISFENANIKWKNQYENIEFDDQQIAIASLLSDASKGIIYSAKDGFLDTMTINAFKQSALGRSILRIK